MSKITKKDLEINQDDDKQTEQLCRLLCKLDKCDPDQTSKGFAGGNVEQGLEYKLWEIRIHKARAIFALLKDRMAAGVS